MKVVILAGGSGTRLWPLSRSLFPKQFLKIGGDKTLLQQTVDRFLAIVSPEEIFIVTSQESFHEVVKQVGESFAENIILEPEKRNTAPAIALATAFLKQKRECQENEVLFITPADHLISPLDSFARYVKEAEKLAEKGAIITLGITPTRPETGYGYIKAHMGKVEKFVEKPSQELAQTYLDEGNYYWNAGMFAFCLETIQREMSMHAPEIGSLTEQPYDKLLSTYSKMPSTSIDYAVMEKTQNALVVPMELEWTDLGSWENVYRSLDKDAKNNALIGEVVAKETTNSLIVAGKRLVTTIGLEDLLVVETDDVVLVAHRKESERVKEIVAELKACGREEVEQHLTVHRPWGSYTVHEESERYKIKKIHIKPLQKLSLQMHYHRSEHWVVVSGTAKVTINGEESVVHEGESIFVPKSAVHKVENPGKVPLEIIEVQVGEYLGEDDILRFEDIYGRVKEDESFKVLRGC